MRKKILQLTVHLYPNIGGVETHLEDLFDILTKREWNIFVLAYQPLSTKTDWAILEKKKNLIILRIPWLRGFFEKLVHIPVLEFLYLVPGLFFVTPIIIIFYRPNMIHAHGISAAVAAVFWCKFFKIKSVISLHSVYSFPKTGLYRSFVKLILENCDFVLSLSNKSNEEIRRLGIKRKKTGTFTYWIDLQKFKRISEAKNKLGWDKKFIVLFVGRLIEEKGIKPLIEAASLWNKKINLVIVGSGLLEEYVSNYATKLKNLSIIGKVDQNDLPLYYSGADCVIVPSTSEEGFGRVIIESLACGTAVLATNRGATSEAMDKTVGRFVYPTPEGIREGVEYFYNNPKHLSHLSNNARKFVERRYSENNVKNIIKAYQ